MASISLPVAFVINAMMTAKPARQVDSTHASLVKQTGLWSKTLRYASKTMYLNHVQLASIKQETNVYFATEFALHALDQVLMSAKVVLKTCTSLPLQALKCHNASLTVMMDTG